MILLFLRSLFFSTPMDKRVEQLGYDVVCNPPGDEDCFYASAARALRIETQGLKNVIFDFLKSHQFDVSIQPIANSRTIKISLLCQFASILTRIFGQNSQLLQCKMGLLAYTTSTVRDICTFAVLCWVTRPLSRFTRVYEGHFMLCFREEI